MNFLNSLGETNSYWLLLGIIVFVSIIWLAMVRRFGGSQEVMLDMLDRFETHGLGSLFHIFVLSGALLLAWVGWMMPAEIAKAFGQDVAGAFPLLENMVGRIVQVIGSALLFLVALRSMRFVVPIMMVLSVVLVSVSAVNYITG